MANPKPVLVLSRSDAASGRLADWLQRNGVTGVVDVRYAEDQAPGNGLGWSATSRAPQLLAWGPQGWAWTSGEQAIRDRVWAARPGAAPPRPTMTAYVSRSCGACQRFLMMLAASEKLLRAVDIKVLEDDQRNVLAMHDAGAQLTPTLVVDGPSGRRVYQGPQASQYLISQA
jgi:hypothetical protein